MHPALISLMFLTWKWYSLCFQHFNGTVYVCKQFNGTVYVYVFHPKLIPLMSLTPNRCCQCLKLTIGTVYVLLFNISTVNDFLSTLVPFMFFIQYWYRLYAVTQHRHCECFTFNIGTVRVKYISNISTIYVFHIKLVPLMCFI